MLFSLAIPPVLAGLVALIVKAPSRRALGLLAGAALALTLLLAAMAATFGWNGTIDWGAGLTLTAALTPLSASVAILVPVIALPILVYAAAHEAKDGLKRLIAILLIFSGGMELLVVAGDFLTLFIGWEIVGACSWALIGHDWREAGNPAAGRYAFLATRLGDLGLLAATMAAFAATGALSFAALAEAEMPLITVVAFGVLLSAAAKSGQVPFSPWLFRAMAGLTSVSALLHAATMVAAGAYLLIRLEPWLASVPGFSATAVAVGLITALAGGVVALMQAHAKKLLAASTSAHYGLMFVAVGAGYPGVAALHLIAHAAFKAVLFLAAGMAGERTGSFALERMGFARAMPLIAAFSAVAALALAGVPPLGGAWTKEAVVTAAGHTSAWISAGVMLAGFFSAAYAMRFQGLVFGWPRGVRRVANSHRTETAAIGGLAGLTLLLSLLWIPAVADSLARLLGVELSESGVVEVLLSLFAVALGLALGAVLANHRDIFSRESPLTEWLGLAIAIDAGVVEPMRRLSLTAAKVDDRLIDGARQIVVRLLLHTSRVFAAKDDRLVDGGVRLTAAFAAWLARIGETIGERITDGLPEGSAFLVGLSGRDIRKVQTGLSHHYYALIAAGSMLTILVLLLGL
ncbi:NADH-quinone oxidoreductase subunit L [Fodinicurvata halophila]|uniref:NADH-quinone oxidoreductase subunit L n=1 Tax=Fodinicurvata halophila TaxID=1419723 RepID=A0ABV8UJB7_9PROT